MQSETPKYLSSTPMAENPSALETTNKQTAAGKQIFNVCCYNITFPLGSSSPVVWPHDNTTG